KLSADDFSVRQKAEAELMRLGRSILPLLKLEARKDVDPEVRRRLEHCVETIEGKKETEKTSSLLSSIARLLAMRKPPGACEVLLAYLPSQDDDDLIEEMQNALNAVAFVDGRPRPALLYALTDKQGVRRAASARALCACRRSDQVAVVRPLLNDPEP